MSATPSTEPSARPPGTDPSARTADDAPPRPFQEPPTFWSVARQPRWILALLGALAVAAIFAALGQWQAGRAVQNAVVTGPNTERVVALTSVARPQTVVTGTSAGRMVSVTGEYVPSGTTLLSGRFRVGIRDGLGGAQGWWVVARVRTSEGDSLAVATGWAATRAEAEAAASRLPSGEQHIVGRYTIGESPAEDDPTKSARHALAPASLVNEWTDPGPTYSGYVVSRAATPGLVRIVSPPPAQAATLSLLNVFYALEWALFAGFALYLWYRLVKDRVEQDTEALVGE